MLASLVKMQKIRRGPKLEGCAFANFGNSSGTEGATLRDCHFSVLLQLRQGKNNKNRVYLGYFS